MVVRPLSAAMLPRFSASAPLPAWMGQATQASPPDCFTSVNRSVAFGGKLKHSQKARFMPILGMLSALSTACAHTGARLPIEIPKAQSESPKTAVLCRDNSGWPPGVTVYASSRQSEASNFWKRKGSTPAIFHFSSKFLHKMAGTNSLQQAMDQIRNIPFWPNDDADQQTPVASSCPQLGWQRKDTDKTRRVVLIGSTEFVEALDNMEKELKTHYRRSRLEVKQLRNAFPGDVENALAWAGQADESLIYFAMHGAEVKPTDDALPETEGSRPGVLILRGGRPAEQNTLSENESEQIVLREAELKRLAHQYLKGPTVVMIESCHSGAFTGQ